MRISIRGFAPPNQSPNSRVTVGVADRRLFASPLLTVAEFVCPPGDDAWNDLNEIGDRPIVVFPRVPVAIRLSHDHRVLATPNLAMLYNPGQLYERELRSNRGDECLYVQLHRPALEALEADGSAIRDGRMVATHAPASRLTYFHQHLLSRYLDGGQADTLLAEETTIRLIRSVVPAPAQAVTARRRATAGAHRALAEDAKELLAATVGENLGLHGIAARLGSSPFHLARVFRRETGFSLHDYRQQLRLRLALEQLPGSGGSLSSLAIGLGFASHSHFTDTFRREFGVAPSVVRDARQISTLLAAA
jgi:AraC family transcriptional regulator